MNTLYRLLEQQTEKLRSQNKELLDFVKMTQVIASHLIQDGDVIGYGCQAAQDLLDSANALCKAHKVPFEVSNRASLLKQAYLSKSKEIIIVFKNNNVIAVPMTWFAPSGTGTIPDPNNIRIADNGQTLCLGEYEVCCDAISDGFAEQNS